MAGNHGDCSHGAGTGVPQRSRAFGHDPPVPHAAFGVIMVEEVPQVNPFHLQTCLKDPAAERRRDLVCVFRPFQLVLLRGGRPDRTVLCLKGTYTHLQPQAMF